MKIVEWENYIFNNYNVKKTKNFLEIMNYMKTNKSDLFGAVKKDNFTIFIKTKDGKYIHKLIPSEENDEIYAMILVEYSKLNNQYLTSIEDWIQFVENKFQFNFVKGSDLSDKDLLLYKEKNAYRIEFITESHIYEDEFYAAYIFNEKDIARQELYSKINTGWKEMIVFVGSKNNIDISDMFMHDSGSLPNDLLNKVYNDIMPKELLKK